MENNQQGIFAWFINNHVAANLLMVLLMAGGFMLAVNMQMEIFPRIDPRIITIDVPYPGSTPQEVEEIINRRVEQVVTGLDGVKKIRSYANEGSGLILLDLTDDAEKSKLLEEVKTEVEAMEDFPPEDADDPSIKISDPNRYVMTIALYGDASERTLRELAFFVRDDLTAIDGISIAEVFGVRDYEIAVEVSEANLQKYKLSFNEVADAVRDYSINLPGGTIRTEAGEILLRADNQAYRQSDFEKLILRTNPDGTVLKLEDVADIKDGFENIETLSLFNDKPSVFIDVLQMGEERILDVEEKVKNYVSNLSLPNGVYATTWYNNADPLRSRIELLVRNGLLGLVLVFAVLVLFLNFRLAFWTTMGIPISFLGAFLLIYLGGGTINMISLFAFIVVLGIVVDDAIIVGESIFSKYEEGMKPAHAALAGLRDVMSPVTVGVLTTIIAFLPTFFSSGILGQIMAVIPLVVVSVLLMSLVEAFIILPAHLSNVNLKTQSSVLTLIQTKLRNGLNIIIENYYIPLLRHSLKVPYIVVAIAIALFMLTMGAINGQLIKTVLFPSIDADEIVATIRLPNGTPAQETELALRHMIDQASSLRDEYKEQLPENSESIIKNISASLGSQPFAERSEGNTSQYLGSNYGEVTIELLPGEERSFSTKQVEARWRELIGDIPGAEIDFISDIFEPGADIYVELSHADFEKLLLISNQLKNTLSSYQGVVDISDNFNPGKPELQLELTDVGLASGLTLSELARQVRQAYYGEEVQRVQRGRDDIQVLVRYSETERESLGSIYDMRIRLDDATEVPLRMVANVTQGRGFSQIERANGRRVVDVTASVVEDIANSNEINQDLRDNILPTLKAEFPSLLYSIEGGQKEEEESFKGLLKALVVALIGIFSLLAVQLKSYTQPIIIMSVIPVGFVGAVIGHVILGYDVSLFSLFGIVALSGVVINDSLILMDMINRQMRSGEATINAVINAGKRRFRPILFTTLTTCAGLSPIIMEKSLQAQFLIPMAISLAAGVVFATLITLILVPALFVIQQEIINYVHKLRANLSISTN